MIGPRNTYFSPRRPFYYKMAKRRKESNRCTKDFFNVSCQALAKSLLGAVLVRSMEGSVLKGIIVETEAYLGTKDKAAHSYGGHRTERNEAMYMQPGTAYVYSIYGIHCCFNISSAGEGAAVLIRAVKPLKGIDCMQKHRSIKSKKNQTIKALCNGPAKLCNAFKIEKSLNKTNLADSDYIWIEEGNPQEAIVSCPRIGIAKAQEWVDKDLRFYTIDKSYYVSKRDTEKERELAM